MSNDEKYMARCIQIARNGLTNTPTNPMVGAVIVHNNMIIGEGYHIKYGEPHAEVNAISSVKNEQLLKESTIYVSLEPCSHYGKTPPCADLIIEKGIRKVVIGCKDPFPLVAGRGIEKLKNAGIEVITGVLENECKELIKRFIVFNREKRPYIILKWAQSADGFIDIKRKGGLPVILSTPLTGMLSHKYRAESSGIMVGKNTARLDNPSLTTRNWFGNNPTRIVIDSNLDLDSSLNIYDNKVKTIIINSIKDGLEGNITFSKVNFNKNIIPEVLEILYKEKIQSVIIEGGSLLLQSFIDYNCWDEAFIELSPIKLEDGVKAPIIKRFYGKDNTLRFSRDIIHLCNTINL